MRGGPWSGFEADQDLGWFWRFKEDVVHPSVYRSPHIDSDRDLNSFGDYPWSSEKPMLIHNTELTDYLRLIRCLLRGSFFLPGIFSPGLIRANKD